MSDSSFDLGREEYVALRATIRERGSLRLVLFVVTIGLWSALVVATAAALSLPVASLIPLLVLAGGFEAVASLHIGVERIGRYIQVRYEGDAPGAPDTTSSWERAAMAWGRRFPGTGTDPLFGAIFYVATALNFLPVALTGVAPELTTLALLHVLFAVRVWRVRAWAARQRSEDLARYQQLLTAARAERAERAES